MRFTFDDLVAVMAHLRSEDGCPWDREQTHATLAPYLLEETHETLDAIARDDPSALTAELGDVLLQVVFHAQIAREAGRFDSGAVVDGLVHKLLDRHPHVFGELRLSTAEEVLAHWDEIKRREAPDRAPADGIPKTLPALSRAQKLLRRSRSDGSSGGGTAADALRGIREKLDAAGARLPHDGKAAASPELEGAIGDLLLAVVALADAGGVDAEAALRRACEGLAERHGAPR
ncbi:MAG TPA: MazG family protein [bacterium]|nr:MazG family protein [bacterium]